MAEDIGGVWRTVGGRRIFIKDGQDLASAMKESGKFNSNKNDIDIDNATLYFRFDDENGFKGKEHMSGVSMWEDQIDDMISDNNEGDYDENDNWVEKNRLLEKYGVTQEQYDDMSDEEQFKIKQEIAIDEGKVTKGASVFALDEEGLEEYNNYIQDHPIDEYAKVHVFTGERNGYGADGEPVVIPDKVVYEGKTSSFTDKVASNDDDEFDFKKINKDIRNMIKKSNNSKE